MDTMIGNDIQLAAAFLRKGQLVGIPTETVYGLAANALNEDAVLHIYKTKQRPQFNPLIVHAASIEQAFSYATSIPDEAVQLAKAFWPGALTLLLNKKNTIPDLITAGSKKVALRVPAHALTLELLQLLDFPLAAPSANPSGYVSPTTAQHVYDHLRGKIPYILDGGACTVGLESTIIGWNEEQQPEVYRLGGISVDAIENILNKKLVVRPSISEQPDAPGQLRSHYATQTPLYVGKAEEMIMKFPHQKIITLNFKNYHAHLPEADQLILAPTGTTEEAARNLFTMLRTADEMNADMIVAEQLPNEKLGAAINDRLQRAQYILKEL